MSKDKGTKNIKKAPQDKSVGKIKLVSSYKSESRSGTGPQQTQLSATKSDTKSGGSKKS